MANQREQIEANVETTLNAMTIANGYSLAKDLRLVTRETLDYDETQGRRPAAILQFTEMPSEVIELAGTVESTLSGRIVFYFDLDTGILPATMANQYTAAARKALMQNPNRGGNALTTRMVDEPTANLWKTGQALQATLAFEVPFIHEDAI